MLQTRHRAQYQRSLSSRSLDFPKASQRISKTDLRLCRKNRISPKYALPAICKSNGQSLAAQQSDG